MSTRPKRAAKDKANAAFKTKPDVVVVVTKPKIIKKRPALATIDEEEKPANKTRTVKPKAVVRPKRKEVPSDDEFELDNDSSIKPAPSKKLKVTRLKNISENKLNVINSNVNAVQNKQSEKVKSPPPKAAAAKKTTVPKKTRVLNLRLIKLPGTPKAAKQEFEETPMDSVADKVEPDDTVAKTKPPKISKAVKAVKAVKAKATKVKPPAKSKNKVSEIPDDIVEFVLETPKASRSNKKSSLPNLTDPLHMEAVVNIDFAKIEDISLAASPPKAFCMDSLENLEKSLDSNRCDAPVDNRLSEAQQSSFSEEEEDQTVPTSENIVMKTRILTQIPSDDSIIILENQPDEIINISDLDSTIGSPMRYNFEMLQTDDETDDEENLQDGQVEPKTGKMRPKPPLWSLSKNREDDMKAQSQVAARTMDNFFYENEDVDLKEIFPNIDSKKIARRASSCHWTTPPRYSIMPKY